MTTLTDQLHLRVRRPLEQLAAEAREAHAATEAHIDAAGRTSTPRSPAPSVPVRRSRKPKASWEDRMARRPAWA